MESQSNFETDEILIKAIVTLKQRQPEVSLNDAFQMNPELFSQKSLVETIFTRKRKSTELSTSETPSSHVTYQIFIKKGSLRETPPLRRMTQVTSQTGK